MDLTSCQHVPPLSMALGSAIILRIQAATLAGSFANLFTLQVKFDGYCNYDRVAFEIVVDGLEIGDSLNLDRERHRSYSGAVGRRCGWL